MNATPLVCARCEQEAGRAPAPGTSHSICPPCGFRTCYEYTGELRQALRLFLETLGRTADDVAANLLRWGVRGDRDHVYDCPVCRLVALAISTLPDPEWHRPCVEGFFLTVADDPAHITVVMPQPVQEFITRFDAGEFPALVADPSEL